MKPYSWVVFVGLNNDRSIDYRKCKEVSEILHLPFITGYKELLFAQDKYGIKYPDNILTTVVSARVLFCDWRKSFIDLLDNSRVIHLRDDYSSLGVTDGRYLYDTSEVWSSIQELCDNKKVFYLDLNKTASNPKYDFKYLRTKKGLVYHGNFRKGRLSSFTKYFCSNKYVTNIFSGGHDTLNWSKFGGNIKLFQSTSPYRLGIFDATIYIEDDHMIESYCSISRRFYESLSIKLPIFFDKRTLVNFKKSNINIKDEWVIESSDELSEKLKDDNLDRVSFSQNRLLTKRYNWYCEITDEAKKLAKSRGVI